MIYVFLWWATMLIIGVAFLPLTNLMFSRFRDHGWIFSKVIGLFIAGWLTWTLNVAGILPFRQMSAILVLGICAVINYLAYFILKRRPHSVGPEEDEEEEEELLPGEEFVYRSEAESFDTNEAAPESEIESASGEEKDANSEDVKSKVAHETPVTSSHITNRANATFAFLKDPSARKLIIIEELIFLGIFLAWMWIVGFKPEAYGTEKFMDYAFLTAMARSDTMPFADPWYAGKTINYYYGGQYITAWLMKLTGTTPGIAYNVMRSLVTAFSFILPFSLGFQLMYDRVNQKTVKQFSKMLSFIERKSLKEEILPAEQMQPQTAGILGSAKAAHHSLRWKGSKVAQEGLRAKKEAEAERAANFLADTEAPSKKHRTRGAVQSASVKDPADKASYACGLLSGMAVALAGTFHYIIFGILKPIAAAITGESYSYWFPDTTRYIGYNPDLPDKTIHEFPAYSSVLGDLHAHYVNILFVVAVIAIAYAWAQKEDAHHPDRLPFLRPEILLIGMLTGVFRWTNFWDFPIYYVTCGSILFFVNLRTYRGHLGKFIGVMLAQAAVMFGVGYAAALPFTLSFWQISSSIGFTHSHTLIRQLLVLWGFPALLLIWFVVTLIREQQHMRRNTRKMQWSAHPIALPDLAVLMFGLCAAGLVWMPEVIYVKDIYGGDNYRANTMFKLTYQAFILLGIVMAYILVRALVVNRRSEFETKFRHDSRADSDLASLIDRTDVAAKSILGETDEADELELTATGDSDTLEVRRKKSAHSAVDALHKKANLKRRGHMGAAIAGIAIICILCGYTEKSISSWFGNVFDASARISDDASVFVAQSFKSDFDAIKWLCDNVEGQPTILEAHGNSYSDCERVSVATGLPTVAGWYVHEWLWRNNLDELNERVADIKTIYTSEDENEVKELIKKYQITYIYIGNLERDTYGNINDILLQNIGQVAYSDGVASYIMKVDSIWQ